MALSDQSLDTAESLDTTEFEPGRPNERSSPSAAAGPMADLRCAVESQRWAEAVGVVCSHWVMLIEEFPAELDFVLQAVPIDAFREVPGAIAIREIWLWTSIEPQHVVPAEVSPTAGEYAVDSGALMRMHPLLREITLEAAHMVAARMGGRLSEALSHADRLEQIGRSIEESIPASRRMRYPLALLQAGITRAVAGDIPGALLVLQSAYERAPYGRSEYVAKGAAGNLALFHALSGDIDLAARWLTRHDELPSVASPHTERVLFTGDLARSVIAIESLDRATAEETMTRLEQGVNVEQTWGPVVTYVHARHGLVWGDRHRSLAWVRRDIERYAGRLGPLSTMGPLLASAEVDLLLSVGRGDQALSRLNRAPDHPLLRVARARLELLAGDSEEAARLVAEVLSLDSTSRVRLEAMIVQAISLARTGQSGAAADVYQMAEDAALATGSRIPLAAIAESDRRALEESRGEPAPDSVWSDAPAPVRPLFARAVNLVRLTNQELMILRGLVSYGSQKEIADAMFLSLNTVKTHLRAAYKKLGASGRSEALTRAGVAGLL